MKQALLVISFLLAGITATAGTAQNDGVITVRTSRAAKALVQKWVDAYKSVRPDVRIEIVSGKTKDADLTLTSSKAEGEPVTFVGRYALLPEGGIYPGGTDERGRKEI